MFKRASSSFILAIVEIAPLVVCSLLASIFVCTVLGLSFSIKEFPIIPAYCLAFALFLTFYLSIRIQEDTKDRLDCYMHAGISSLFVAYLNCEILRELGLIYGWMGNSYWEYKLAYFATACFWHGFIMLVLFKMLKKRKAASIRMQPRSESLD